MPKNLVVCCDGTGNQFGEQNSNVIKLYTCLKGEGQGTYYHPGVGTMGSPGYTTAIGKGISRIAGLAFGYGFRANIADAYRFLMEHYEPGDHIYLFGFSRGAYTVRALAGALFLLGLLCRGNEGHLPYLLRMYSDASRKAFNVPKSAKKVLTETDDTKAFRETFSRVVPIHFVGIWDTVSSVGWIYDPVKLLFDGRNPIMRKGRHAISVDERRCFFQENPWGSPLPPEETPVLREHYTNPEDRQQDIVQAWFAGVHSDVGGSFQQDQCSPAMQALRWILQEAKEDGLCVSPEKEEVIFGKQDPLCYPGLTAKNRPADPDGHCLHLTFDWRWFPLELFPHKYFDVAGNKHWRFLPWPHRREIPAGALIHPSLRDRLAEEGAAYRPPNLPAACIVPYERDWLPALHPAVQETLQEQGFGVYLPHVSKFHKGKSGPTTGRDTRRKTAALAGLGLVSLMAARVLSMGRSLHGR